MHKIWSSTKSVTSAVFGIAIGKGLIKSIDEPVIDFFPEFGIKDIALKKKITLRHLLTMSSGLDWPETDSAYTAFENPVRRMKASENWSKYVLDRPVKERPGLEFNYNSGGSYLLGHILQKKTGDILIFAENNLFKPLGISNYYWSKNTNGVINGSYGLEMRTRDMAKFGYLYLKGGYWEGQQIIPRTWVEESTSRHIKKTGKPPGNAPYYGYQWYIHSHCFHSFGYQGQYIFVIPDYEMVAVFTSYLLFYQQFFIPRLVEHYAISSVKTAKPLPINHKSEDLLKSQINQFTTGWWVK